MFFFRYSGAAQGSVDALISCQATKERWKFLHYKNRLWSRSNKTTDEVKEKTGEPDFT
jgi:hypothetical protein